MDTTQMNDISTLMSRMEEINRITNPRDITPDDISTIIAYHRRARARKAAGEKSPPRGSSTPSSVDLSALLNLPTSKSPSSVPLITRRI